MRETYTFHRRVLKLLQWHCPPILWHLKTPVHMFALDALVEAYPNAKFLWSHRDPAKVMGSVCSLIRYVRSWSSDRDDPAGTRRRAAGQLGRGHPAGDGFPQTCRRRPIRRRRLRRPADRPGRTRWRPATSPWLDLHRRHRAFGRAVGRRAQARLTRRTQLRPGRLRPDARGRARTVRGVPRAPTTRPHDLGPSTHTTTREARSRPRCAPRHPGRGVEICSRARSSGLSIAAVLDRAQLGTRAFYRHFESKDQLVAAVFLEMARAEMRRLQKEMAAAADAVDAVAAWIDGRLDLAFDENIRSDLRRLSLEAQSQMFASPELVQPAYAEMLDAARRTTRSAAWNTACSTTSIRSPMRSRSRAWCGPAPNGNGRQASANAPTSASVLCASACAASASRLKRSRRPHGKPLTDKHH